MAKLEKYSSPFRWGVKNVTNQRTNERTDKAFLGVGCPGGQPLQLEREKIVLQPMTLIELSADS